MTKRENYLRAIECRIAQNGYQFKFAWHRMLGENIMEA